VNAENCSGSTLLISVNASPAALANVLGLKRSSFRGASEGTRLVAIRSNLWYPTSGEHWRGSYDCNRATKKAFGSACLPDDDLSDTYPFPFRT